MSTTVFMKERDVGCKLTIIYTLLALMSCFLYIFFDSTLFYEQAFNLLVSTSGRFLYFYVLRATSWRASPSCVAACFSACRLNASAASKEYFPKVGLFI